MRILLRVKRKFYFFFKGSSINNYARQQAWPGTTQKSQIQGMGFHVVNIFLFIIIIIILKEDPVRESEHEMILEYHWHDTVTRFCILKKVLIC